MSDPKICFEAADGLLVAEAWMRLKPEKAGAIKASYAFGLVRKRASVNVPFRLDYVRPFEHHAQALRWAELVAKREINPLAPFEPVVSPPAVDFH